MKVPPLPLLQGTSANVTPIKDLTLKSRVQPGFLWGEREIRLVITENQGTLPRSVWKSLEAAILQGHAAFLRALGAQNEPLQPFLLQKIYYHTEVFCGVIEVTEEGDAALFRDLVIPTLDLPIRLHALIKTDGRVPILSTFTPQVYHAYTTSDYVDLMKLVNPILSEKPFNIIQEEKRDHGRLLYFKTTHTVLNYVKDKLYILPHALGQTIFNR